MRAHDRSHDPYPSAANGYAYRWGQWKLAVGGISCQSAHATFNCSKPQLYDLSVDVAEDHDLALQRPDVLAAIEANFSAWFASVNYSIANESKCASAPRPPNPVPFPREFGSASARFSLVAAERRRRAAEPP